MRVKIILDREPGCTRVVDADTGHIIEQVLSVEYEVGSPNDFPIARVTFWNPEIEVFHPKAPDKDGKE